MRVDMPLNKETKNETRRGSIVQIILRGFTYILNNKNKDDISIIKIL